MMMQKNIKVIVQRRLQALRKRYAQYLDKCREIETEEAGQILTLNVLAGFTTSLYSNSNGGSSICHTKKGGKPAIPSFAVSRKEKNVKVKFPIIRSSLLKAAKCPDCGKGHPLITYEQLEETDISHGNKYSVRELIICPKTTKTHTFSTRMPVFKI